MKKEISTSSNKSGDTYRHTETSDGITTNFEVKEVENGFIVKVCKYGYQESNKKSDTYIDEEKVYISKENPLAETPKSLKEQINDALSNLKV